MRSGLIQKEDNAEWSSLGKRKTGNPKGSWRDEVDEAKVRRELSEGEWEDYSE